MRRIHAIVTRGRDDSFLVESPQIPGFVMIRNSMPEVARDLRSVLAGLVEDSFKIVGHHQWAAEYPGNPGLLFRVQDGEGEDERIRAVSLVQGAVSAGFQADWPQPGLLGDVLVIGCAATDNLGMITDQVANDDGIPMLALQGDGGIWVVSLELVDDVQGQPLDEAMSVSAYVDHARRVASRQPTLVVAA